MSTPMTDDLRDYWTKGPGSESLCSPGWLARSLRWRARSKVPVSQLVDTGSRSGVATLTMRPGPRDRFAPDVGDVLVVHAYWGAEADTVAPSGWTELRHRGAEPHPRGMAKSALWWYRVTALDFPPWPTLHFSTATWVEYEFCRYAGVPSW